MQRVRVCVPKLTGFLRVGENSLECNESFKEPAMFAEDNVKDKTTPPGMIARL